MTPKEKAIELYEKYYYSIPIFEVDINYEHNLAKQCALIAVDEINKAIDFDWMEIQNLESQHRFWYKVKQEIEKL